MPTIAANVLKETVHHWDVDIIRGLSADGLNGEVTRTLRQNSLSKI